jgi:hypothetical protein
LREVCALGRAARPAVDPRRVAGHTASPRAQFVRGQRDQGPRSPAHTPDVMIILTRPSPLILPIRRSACHKSYCICRRSQVSAVPPPPAKAPARDTAPSALMGAYPVCTEEWMVARFVIPAALLGRNPASCAGCLVQKHSYLTSKSESSVQTGQRPAAPLDSGQGLSRQALGREPAGMTSVIADPQRAEQIGCAPALIAEVLSNPGECFSQAIASSPFFCTKASSLREGPRFPAQRVFPRSSGTRHQDRASFLCRSVQVNEPCRTHKSKSPLFQRVKKRAS